MLYDLSLVSHLSHLRLCVKGITKTQRTKPSDERSNSNRNRIKPLRYFYSQRDYTASMAFLKAEGIGKKEGELWTLQNVSFTLRPLQKLALAGATGSGKTTLLKIIAGLTEPTTGAVYFNDERIKGPTEKLLPGHPSVAYLSQHFELRNHYRVKEILAMAKTVSDDEAERLYEVCRIGHLLHRWTHQLSGGERQRIALARLLAGAPQLLLLDEPYSNLDALHKTVLKDVVLDLGEQTNLTVMLVSHDPQDVLSWADEILVLNNGETIQQAAPKEMYANPLDEYTAGLFGRYNVLTHEVAKALSPYCEVEMQELGRFVRPEEFSMVEAGKGLKAILSRVLFMGSYSELRLCAGNLNLIVHTATKNLKEGDEVYLTLQGKQQA